MKINFNQGKVNFKTGGKIIFSMLSTTSIIGQFSNESTYGMVCDNIQANITNSSLYNSNGNTYMIVEDFGSNRFILDYSSVLGVTHNLYIAKVVPVSLTEFSRIEIDYTILGINGTSAVISMFVVSRWWMGNYFSNPEGMPYLGFIGDDTLLYIDYYGDDYLSIDEALDGIEKMEFRVIYDNPTNNILLDVSSFLIKDN